jgi:glycosyltransferase involved in cell wall biosynthesis
LGNISESKRVKKILFVPSLNLGVIWWRIEMMAQALVKKKDRCAVFVDYLIDPSHPLAWDKVCVGHGQLSEEIQSKISSAFNHFDVIVFQKVQNKEALALLKKYSETHMHVKQVMELDDSIGDTAPCHDHKTSLAHSYAAEHCYMSDAVIASTEFLAESIKPYLFEGTPVHVAHNCILDEEWRVEKTKRPKRDTIRVGYVGGSAHDEDIELVYEVMLDILDTNKDVEFVIRYGGYKPDYMVNHERFDFKQVEWHPSKYPQKLWDMDLDIGLAPLLDTNFNRCKSAIKWLEWAYMDVPVVASNMESYNKLDDIVLANNTYSDWKEALQSTIDRIRNGEVIFPDLHKKAKERFDIDKEADSYLDFLCKI